MLGSLQQVLLLPSTVSAPKHRLQHLILLQGLWGREWGFLLVPSTAFQQQAEQRSAFSRAGGRREPQPQLPLPVPSQLPWQLPRASSILQRLQRFERSFIAFFFFFSALLSRFQGKPS